MRRCFSAFVGGEGSITSQVSGARFAGSAESKVCKKVVPVRGNPTTKRGARIWCCAISGCRLRSRCSKSRLRRMRRTSERSAMVPIAFRRASRQQDSSRRPSGSRKSPSPKSSEIGAALCRLDQLLRRNAPADLAIKHCAKSVKCADDNRRTETIDGERRIALGQHVPIARR